MDLSRSSRSIWAPPSSRWGGEATLEELLSDPIVTALMKADGVSRGELEVMLRRIAIGSEATGAELPAAPKTPRDRRLESREQEDTMPDLVPKLPIQDELLLLVEFNHRINNEFASLISVLCRTAAASTNDEVKRALNGVAQLLHHHADIHRALRLPDDDDRVDAADYLGTVCRSISRAKLDRLNINLVLVADPLPLESSRCWRVGMIVSELITNAARHAFPGRRGEIRIELFRAGRFAKCVVADNGSAPAQVQPGRGFRIVEALTTGLDGWFERKFGPAGSSSILTLPYPHPTEESRRWHGSPKAPEASAHDERM